jgi:hypothetical protein
MNWEQPREFLQWVSAKRALVLPPSDAGHEYALDLSGWEASTIPVSFPYPVQIAMERDIQAAVAPLNERVKSAAA